MLFCVPTFAFLNAFAFPIANSNFQPQIPIENFHVFPSCKAAFCPCSFQRNKKRAAFLYAVLLHFAKICPFYLLRLLHFRLYEIRAVSFSPHHETFTSLVYIIYLYSPAPNFALPRIAKLGVLCYIIYNALRGKEYAYGYCKKNNRIKRKCG